MVIPSQRDTLSDRDSWDPCRRPLPEGEHALVAQHLGRTVKSVAVLEACTGGLHAALHHVKGLTANMGGEAWGEGGVEAGGIGYLIVTVLHMEAIGEMLCSMYRTYTLALERGISGSTPLLT